VIRLPIVAGGWAGFCVLVLAVWIWPRPLDEPAEDEQAEIIESGVRA
jgi:hypothetical protein